jgi:4-hydroxybenzoate polyprenyltransferase
VKTLRQYLPSLGMALAAVLSILYTAFQDDRLSLTEVLNLLIAAVGAFVTFILPRLEGFQWLKAVCSAVTAGLVFLVSAFADGAGVSGQEWVMLGIQVLVGLGIVAGFTKDVPITLRGSDPAARVSSEGTGPARDGG